MAKQQTKQRIEKLKKVINYHRYLYHVLNRQEISDAALDSLKKELFDLERKFPELVTPDSPTQRVGGKPQEQFKKFSHPQPMLSFNDAFSEKDMKDWIERISKLLTTEEIKLLTAPSHHFAEGGTGSEGLRPHTNEIGSEGFYGELKIDGLAIELIYENGIFKTGSTRGDGRIGEDVSQNLKTIEAIPLRIREKKEIIKDLKKHRLDPGIIEAIENYDFKKPIVARGEIFISKKEFERINKEQKKAGLSVYANPRNLAAGSIRQLDPKVTASRNLDSFAYDLITDFGTKTHEEKHKILKTFGFKTNPHNKYCPNLREIFKFYKQCQKLRKKLSYEIDGMVVIINSNKIFEKLGIVGKAPRGAIALKFPLKQATTIVQDIKVQVGRTGALTPVAYLKPVPVSGVTISRATLHNEDEIKRLGVKIGDTVIIGRAGDVIPDIVKVLPDLRTGEEKEFKMPTHCPICGSKAIKPKREVVSRCPNPNCFARQKEYLYHFISKKAFDIEGLGPKIIGQLMEKGLISDPADIFELKEGDLLPLERFAEKSAKNLIEAIQKNKKITLPKFIYALGIRNVGEETARDLAEHFGSLEKLKNASKEDLERVMDIGPKAAKSIYEWFHQEKHLEFLEKLKKLGVKIATPDVEELASARPSFSEKNLGGPEAPRETSGVEDIKGVEKQKLRGKTFVLTGSLETMDREQAKEKIRELGGDISKSVSKKTNFLIVGKKHGSKLEKARKLGIKIIKEKEFLKTIK